MVKGNSNKILIVTTGGIGQAVQVSGAIAELKKVCPHLKLYLLTTSLGKETLFHNPHIEDEYVITYQSKIALWFTLRKMKFDTIYSYDQTVDRFVSLLNVPIVKKEFSTTSNIVTTQDEVKEASTFLRVAGWDLKKPIVMLHPFTSKTYKEWPPEYFIKVANHFKDHFILVTGSRKNAKQVKEITRHIEGAVPLIGQASLRTLICILQKTTLLLTNDSGMIHLANSQNTPTLALSSPTQPIEGCHTIHKHRACIPCLKKRCHDPFCMRQIGVDEVIEKMGGILNAR